MRVAVISDVHADLAALERVLAVLDASTPDEIWCLGDVVGLGGGNPAEVVDLVREQCAVVLAGNHDAWVAGTLPLDVLPLPRQKAELVGQRGKLSAEQLAWLAARPSHARHHGVELWHGSAEDPITGWVNTRVEAASHLDRQREPIGVVGHTHRPIAAHRRGGSVLWIDPPPDDLDLGVEGAWLLNPGAVAGSTAWLDLDLSAGTARWRRA